MLGSAGFGLQAVQRDAQAALEVVPQPQDVAHLVHDHPSQAFAHQHLQLGFRQRPQRRQQQGAREPGEPGLFLLMCLCLLGLLVKPVCPPHAALRLRSPRLPGRCLRRRRRLRQQREALLVGDVGGQQVQLLEPGPNPAFTHADVRLDDLTRARIHLGIAFAGDLICDGPGDGAVASVRQVVVTGPVRVLRQHRLHVRSWLQLFEARIPSLDTLLDPQPPSARHGGVDVHPDGAVGQLRQIPAPNHGGQGIHRLARQLLASFVVPDVCEVRGEVEQPVVRHAGRHGRFRQHGQGEAQRDRGGEAQVLHGEV
mmetsp:Transcript_60559/g.144296  ORF Transcript_60559/g.144296 Transcript_60559/m.144296 type:complete len:311 (+) Transcript_60559:1810-2742(+)